MPDWRTVPARRTTPHGQHRLRTSPTARRLCGGARRGRSGLHGPGRLRGTYVRSDCRHRYARRDGEHADQRLECHSRHSHMSLLSPRDRPVSSNHSHRSAYYATRGSRYTA